VADVLAFDISALTLEAVKPFGLGNKEALRCKNMWTLGLALWMFDREPRSRSSRWLNDKFAKNPVLAEANIAALNAGHAYGETAEIGGPLTSIISIPAQRRPGCTAPSPARRPSPRPRRGRAACGLPMFFGGYPITPASLDPARAGAKLKEFGVTTFQAEDEIAAICAAIGASYAGSLASPRRPAPASRSRARRWALRS
jgi:2-oxoglutarate ferredoxin oxidoreductase subunit alpha